MSAPGLLIAAPRSNDGKTTVALGLMMAFQANGLRVAAAKCGPDYIDPAFHAAATGRAGVNLDSWAMDRATICHLAARQGREADLILAEALMGLFDGVAGPLGTTGSSADIAALTGWPVVLVLDVSGQAQTAAALALGCKLFDKRIQLAGIVLNRVGSDSHRQKITAALTEIGLPTLGALPRNPDLVLPQRHLGLVQARERPELAHWLERLGGWVARHVDLATLASLAKSRPLPEENAIGCLPPPGQRIALADDAAFSFTYPHLLAAWQKEGAEIRLFSPLEDQPPPQECDICWLAGGYPELHAGRLASCQRFMTGLRDFAASRPVHGECGGYMALGEALIDANGQRHTMAGLLPVTASFAHRQRHLGYRRLELTQESVLGPVGRVWRGHEFHYASLSENGTKATALALAWDAAGQALGPTGHVCGRVSGSFFHLIAMESATSAQPLNQGKLAGQIDP